MNCMNIYLVRRTNVDALNSAWSPDEWVVFAKDKPSALCISPDSPEAVSLYREVTVTLLGTAFEESEAGLICASFAAG